MLGWIYNWIWPQKDTGIIARTTRTVAIHTGIALTLGQPWTVAILAIQWRGLVYYLFRILTWF